MRRDFDCGLTDRLMFALDGVETDPKPAAINAWDESFKKSLRSSGI